MIHPVVVPDPSFSPLNGISAGDRGLPLPGAEEGRTQSPQPRRFARPSPLGEGRKRHSRQGGSAAAATESAIRRFAHVGDGALDVPPSTEKLGRQPQKARSVRLHMQVIAFSLPSPRGENRCGDCRTCGNVLLWRVSLKSAQCRGESKEGRSPLLCRFN